MRKCEVLKFINFACLGICLAIPFVLRAEFGEPTVPRSIKLNENRQLTLVKDGKAFCEIVSGATTSPIAKFAAQELRKYLSESTGVEIEIVEKPSKNDKTAIIVGTGADVEKLPRDAFIIRAVGNQIIIAGRDDKIYSPLSPKCPFGDYYERATLFGVYDFLERFVGARFVFPGEEGTVIPEHKVLKVPTMDILERPDNIVRCISWTSGAWYGKLDVLFNQRLNNYRLRIQTDFIPNCHGLGRMAYVERFGQSHPEYFALKANGMRANNISERNGGQLCFNSGIKEEIYQDAKAFLTGHDAKSRNIYHNRYMTYVWDKNAASASYFNVMPQDGMMMCNCDICKKADAGKMDTASVKPVFFNGPAGGGVLPDWVSDQVWQITCDMGIRLANEGIKGFLTQMAYGNHAKIPPCDIPRNVLVQVAVNGPWSEMDTVNWNTQLEYIKDWTKKLNRKTWLWTYVNKYGGTNIPAVPCSTPRAIGRFYTEVQPEIFGAYMESETDYVVFQFFNWYVFGKKMWDFSIDTKKLLSETYADMFKEGAKPMEEFFDRLEVLWLSKVVARKISTQDGFVFAPPSSHELWNDIYSKEELEKLNALLLAAESAVAKNSKALKRVRFMRENFYETLASARDRFFLIQKNVSQLGYNLKKLDDVSIKLDGIPDETVWKNSDVIHLSGLKGAETQVETNVRAFCDNDNLYIAWECTEPEMSAAFCQELPPDDPSIWTNNSFEIFLTPELSRKEYYQMIINDKGNMADLHVSRENGGKCDFSWNSEASLKTARCEKGWTGEIQIPLEKLGIQSDKNIIGNFTRSRVLENNKPLTRYYSWSPFIQTYNDAENFGTLHGEKKPSVNILSDGCFNVVHSGRNFGKWVTAQEWVLPGNGFISLDPLNFLLGGRSLKINNPGGKNINITQYLDGLKDGKQYKITAFIRTELASLCKAGGGVLIQFYNGSEIISIPNPIVQRSTPWTGYSSIIKIRKNTADKRCYIRLCNSFCESTAWFDNIIIEEMKN